MLEDSPTITEGTLGHSERQYGPIVRDQAAVDHFFRTSTDIVDGLIDAVEVNRLDDVRGLMQHMYLDAERTGLVSIADACLRIEEICSAGRRDPQIAQPVLVDRVDELFVALGDALDEHLEHKLAEDIGLAPDVA